MVLVFENTDEEKVKQFIARFSNVVGDGDDALQMGPAPPCEGYAKLRVVDSLKQLIEKYNGCRTPKQLKARAHGHRSLE